MSSSANAKAVVLVTGANKGIGYEIVEQLSAKQPSLTVLLGSRDAARGQEAVNKLKRSNVKSIGIDVDDSASIDKAVAEVKASYGGLDILINNAGMAFKGNAFDENVVRTTFKTNYYGLLNVTNKFLPVIRDNGRIINVSSVVSVMTLPKLRPDLHAKFVDEKLTIDGLSSLMESFCKSVAAGTWKEDGWPESGYGMSKVGVSILTSIQARQPLPRGIKVNAGCPGWCKSDMAGWDAPPRSAADGAANFVHLALLPYDQLPNGEYWSDSKKQELIQPLIPQPHHAHHHHHQKPATKLDQQVKLEELDTHNLPKSSAE